jgi:hypothetical protein
MANYLNMAPPTQPDLATLDEAVAMSTPELEAAVRKQQLKSLLQQQQAIEQQRALNNAALEATTPQTDLTAFYSALRGMQGLENAGEGYKASGEDPVSTAVKLREQLQKSQDTYSDNLTNNLKSMLAEKVAEKRHRETLARMDQSDNNRLDRLYTKATEPLYKIGEKAAESLKQHDEVAKALTPEIVDGKEVIKLQTLKNTFPKIAQAMGQSKVLSDLDIKNLSDESWQSKLISQWEKITNKPGYIDANDKEVARFRELIKRSAVVMADQFKNQLELEQARGMSYAPTAQFYAENQPASLMVNAINKTNESLKNLTPSNANAGQEQKMSPAMKMLQEAKATQAALLEAANKKKAGK